VEEATAKMGKIAGSGPVHCGDDGEKFFILNLVFGGDGYFDSCVVLKRSSVARVWEMVEERKSKLGPKAEAFR
jgi:hypothetical protein